MACILLVDDHDVFLHAIHRVLQHAGHEVHDASNGIEALRRFVPAYFDLVITDLIMPDKEGIETIIEMKKKDPAIRIIAMSGGGRGSPTAYLEIALTLGAVCTLTKPFNKEELLHAVQLTLATKVDPTGGAKAKPVKREKAEVS